MDEKLLEVKNLSVEYKDQTGYFKAVRDVDLDLYRGESIGIIGESGSGKTSFGKALLSLIKSPDRTAGTVSYKGQDLNSLSEEELNRIRWKEIAIVFQNSLDVLNPLLTIGEQIGEVLTRHMGLGPEETSKRIDSLLEKVGLRQAVKYKYPHELSGGMRQKVLIAMAISCQPKILIVDEPTSALDIVSKNNIIKLLLEIKEKEDLTMLVISHELDTVLKLTEKVNVMYYGKIVESGLSSQVLFEPMHSYTRGLINSSPAIDPFGDMWGIPGDVDYGHERGCPFRNRCTQSSEGCALKSPDLKKVAEDRYVACNKGGIVTLLRGEHISKEYRSKKENVIACENCSMEIKSGEIVALIGESGSGKTSLGSILAGILDSEEGDIYFLGQALEGNNMSSRKNGIQMVFQDPFSSINEKLTIEQVVGEPLEILAEENRQEKIKSVLRAVKFNPTREFLERRCSSLSGGQRQRLALARSLIMEPKLLIADEISSMLDISTEANILRLLKELQNEKGFSMLYITHDLAVARKISDKVYVMKDGKIVEKGHVKQIFTEPESDYLKELISEYSL